MVKTRVYRDITAKAYRAFIIISECRSYEDIFLSSVIFKSEFHYQVVDIAVSICRRIIFPRHISSATAEQKRQRVGFMRSLKICSAVIYFMAKGEKFTKT
ncbi:hypothetical protein [Rahnella aceris]|uniref:hypothetical protein n=1 Tax=Rahnella sp. (strain Y9602) TaxID=2703885 RepID=UPI001C25E0EC|nr:hypothetical protein [Rahnella aceris]MBU9848619.1 hypothetical protein [Rahnella aceris]